ncbi:GNAT family N-acetyltransferase [Wenzhouxiangella marina]|uniref:Aminoalkylphosphonic acid N-acetyltransferase n=1 Tax=Wenzhouxiangella marina TaxID=1579979 RepID=A0A0K0Y0H6_9GAMM|nr:GNAT family N-acetyltransferase [Wenzhouxiangella marina]AKS43392.1 Aminoalkylphosphonic acid N-acetyltransferase [Wenzhouxiangella marina]MBB6088492.1 ribosomal protein S18 acetylase RimI-like enzyme [Wenzhouxiangella marina]
MAELRFRLARDEDLPVMVELLADDPLGQTRERQAGSLDPAYREAFDAIEADPNNELLVCESAGQLVGMLQISYLPSLTHAGSWRAQIEGVRVARSARGRGIGHELLRSAIERARSRQCQIVQLTTDKQRVDAIRFYEQLGFRSTHEGMKLRLVLEPRS